MSNHENSSAADRTQEPDRKDSAMPRPHLRLAHASPGSGDFASRAVSDWEHLQPEVAAEPAELEMLIRLSRVTNVKDRLDERALRRFEGTGIRGFDDFRALVLLRRSASGLSNRDMIEELGGSKAGMSARLDRLTNLGLTERVPSQVDRRSHTNVLTDAGTELADQVALAIVEGRRPIVEALGPDGVDTLSECFRVILEHTSAGG